MPPSVGFCSVSGGTGDLCWGSKAPQRCRLGETLDHRIGIHASHKVVGRDEAGCDAVDTNVGCKVEGELFGMLTIPALAAP